MRNLQERQKEMYRRLTGQEPSDPATRKLPRFRYTVKHRKSKHPMKFSRLVQAKFWTLVHKTNDCWFWIGPVSHGYGNFGCGGVQIIAHRYSWELANWEIASSRFQVHHLCKNRTCVCPDHLQLVTPDEHGKMHRKNQKNY